MWHKNKNKRGALVVVAIMRKKSIEREKNKVIVDLSEKDETNPSSEIHGEPENIHEADPFKEDMEKVFDNDATVL